TDVPLGIFTYSDPHASWRLVALVRPEALPPEATTHKPTVVCGTPGAKVPTITLAVNGGTPVAGEFGTTAWKGSASDAAGDTIPGHKIAAKAGDRLEVRIANGVCAASWLITYGLDETRPGEPGSVEPFLYFDPPQANPDGDLDFAAENRFRSTAAAGDWILHASLQFPDGGAEVYWHVVVAP
ncbi:MAG: hypothetical protein ACJ77F_01305, partial [Chloroflexota bacterium]